MAKKKKKKFMLTSGKKHQKQNNQTNLQLALTWFPPIVKIALFVIELFKNN